MSLYARIDNGILLELLETDGDITQMFDPSWIWIDITNIDPQPTYYWTWDGTVFSPPVDPTTLPQAQATARNDLWFYCDVGITRAMFTSQALGNIYNYDCRIVDQLNLTMRYNLLVNAPAGSTQPLWASDGTRFDWIEHTMEELLIVMEDMNNHIKVNQTHLASKLAAVDAATTVAEARAIVW